jgi:hypothetical protein
MRSERAHVWRAGKTIGVLSFHAFIIWFACGLTIALGRGAFGMERTLMIHAIVAPAVALIVSFIYFEVFRLTTPFATAAFFTLFIVALDALLVAPVFEKSYAMFASPLGMWWPLLSIFAATYLAGVLFGGPLRPIPTPH